MPPATRRPRARSYDPARTWSALTAQVEHVRAAAHRLSGEQWDRPGGLPGWDVTLLVVHIARQVEAVRVLLEEPAPPAGTKVTDLSTWALSTAGIADKLDESTREAAGRTDDPAALLDAEAAALGAYEKEALRADRVIPHVFGAMRSLDFTVTRLVELVVHSDDLARATGLGIPLDKQALAATVRLLADALAAKVPGNSVEVRVPPFAAVQCVPGPRHTRGTPPNVVETDPLTWLRLATGRTTWADARHHALVAASGERADLTAYLPVMS
jgi:uncharacterized protein (TIGR03083 family)